MGSIVIGVEGMLGGFFYVLWGVLFSFISLVMLGFLFFILLGCVVLVVDGGVCLDMFV